MSAVLVNLAMMMSFFLFVLTLAVGWLRGVSPWPLFIRSSIIFTISSLVILLFFRYFNLILVRFLSQRIRENWNQKKEAEQEDES